MYPLDPPAVYIHESVMSDKRCRRRAEGVVQALKRPVEPVVFCDKDLPRLLKEGRILENRKAMGSLKEVRDPILLFNTFRFDGGFNSRYEALKAGGCDIDEGTAKNLLGELAFHWACYNMKGDPHRKDKVCRPCWRIHLQNGCLHRCKYCGLGGLLVSNVNVEDYCRYLGQIMERHPWQTTYLLDDDADPPCLEPEHGVMGPLMEFFGSWKEERYLIVHTKTSNTEWFKGAGRRGRSRTIGVWSISGSSQSRILEPNAGTTEERVEAARAAEKAGITVRYKFKPIIPVRSWRKDAADAVRLIFERTNPDIISLCCFMWMDVDALKACLPAEELDPECLKAAEEAREETKDTMTKPFPEKIRAEIYSHYLSEIRRWNKIVPVSISTENFSMWKRLGSKLGMTATDYVCGCGPMCVPGLKRLDKHPFRTAVRNDGGEIPGTF